MEIFVTGSAVSRRGEVGRQSLYADIVYFHL